MQLGPVAPFDASAVVLLIGGAVIVSTWNENYGDSKNQDNIVNQFKVGVGRLLLITTRDALHTLQEQS